MELQSGKSGSCVSECLNIISSEFMRIESIVRNFLQTIFKSESQIQLVDFNQIIEKTLYILCPCVDVLVIDLQTNLDRGLGPVRVVLTDIE